MFNLRGKKEWLLAIFISISLLLSNVSFAQNNPSFEDIFGIIFLGKLIITPECEKAKVEPGPVQKLECPSGYQLLSNGLCGLIQIGGPIKKCLDGTYPAKNDINICCPSQNMLKSGSNCVCETGVWNSETKRCEQRTEPGSGGTVVIPGGTVQQCPSGQVRDPATGECIRTEPAPKPQISCQEFASYNQGTDFGNKASIYECRDTVKASMSLQSSGLCGREVQPQLFAYFDPNIGCCSGTWSPSYNPIQYPETFCGYYRNTDWTSVNTYPVIIHTRTWFAKNRDEYETCAEINSKRSLSLETC